MEKIPVLGMEIDLKMLELSPKKQKSTTFLPLIPATKHTRKTLRFMYLIRLKYTIG